jgi:hypothetical protein
MSRTSFVHLNSVPDLVPTVKRHPHSLPESVEFQRNSSFTLGTAQGLNILVLPFKPACKCCCLKSVLAVRQHHKSVGTKIAKFTPNYAVCKEQNFTLGCLPQKSLHHRGMRLLSTRSCCTPSRDRGTSPRKIQCSCDHKGVFSCRPPGRVLCCKPFHIAWCICYAHIHNYIFSKEKNIFKNHSPFGSFKKL